MPSFTKGGPSLRQPFGSNEYLRSTQDVKKNSFTVAAASVPNETIDGVVQKMLLPGEVMAKITSGGDTGKVGPFMAGATDGRQTLANIVGLNDTWLPWQLMEHDNEIAVTYEATCVQAWCFERDSSGARIALTNTTAAAMIGQKTISLMFN